MGSGRGRGRGGDDDSALDLGWNLVTAHVSLGLLVVLLAVVRVVWRRVSGLPPWAETLGDGERRLVTVTERVLLTLLFVVPLTGLALVLGDDDLLCALHVARAHAASCSVHGPVERQPPGGLARPDASATSGRPAVRSGGRRAA